MQVLPSCIRVISTLMFHHLNFNATLREKARWELHKDAVYYFQEDLDETSPLKKATAEQPHISLLTDHLRQASHAEHCYWSKDLLISKIFQRTLHIYTPGWADYQKLTSIKSEWTVDIVYRTCKERWPIETNDKKEQSELMLSIYLDHNDNYMVSINKI